MKKVFAALIISVSVAALSPTIFVQAQTQTQTQAPTSCIVLTRNLSYGVRDFSLQSQVVTLQTFLISHGYHVSSATGYFGRETQHAVMQFQKDNGVSAVGSVGPITRQKIRVITCSIMTTSPSLPQTLPTSSTTSSTITTPNSTQITSTTLPPSVSIPSTSISPSPSPTPAQPSGAQYGSYARMIFDDEFNGTTLSAVWDPHYYWWWGNKNLEFIPDNVTVQNGMLRLKAQKDSSALSQGTGYTKAAVNTYNGVDHSRAQGFAFQYGFAEARVRVSPGQGLWPAFWAKPLADVNNDPEIDFFEGLKDDSKSFYDTYMTLHSPAVTQNHITTANFADGNWHTIGFEWDQNHMTWLIDGVPQKTVTGSLVVTQPITLSFDLDIDCSKDVCWQKPTNASTSNPAYFDIDYIRVWQK